MYEKLLTWQVYEVEVHVTLHFIALRLNEEFT